MTSTDGDSCACGCPTARVRVRGNAFSATCVDCGRTAIVPMLAEPELLEAFGESDVIAPIVQLRREKTKRVSWTHGETFLMPALDAIADSIDRRMQLGVEFRLPTP